MSAISQGTNFTIWYPDISYHRLDPYYIVYYMVGAEVQLVEYRTGNQEVAGSTRTRSTASNLEQVANLLCAQTNSAYYPQRDGKWVVATATGWRPGVADWGDGASASCTVGPIVR